MSVLEKIPAVNYFTLIGELLDKQQKARITVTGSSMFPFLRNLNDCVELGAESYEHLRVRDIVLIKRCDGRYILHRVFRKDCNCFYILGDAQSCIEGPLMPEQLLAVASAVWRGKKRISCDNPWWRFLSYAWLALLPFRGFILGFLRKAKQLAGF
ncbi:MAG TPA: S24/S26 family peptidase [Caldisericia bacterium]|nr:S24/S26 family peptidase [Caldisericia bacterium]